MLLLAGVFSGRADLEVFPTETPQILFAGTPATALVTLRNPDPERHEQEFSIRLVQLSSTTAMPIGERRPWKKIEVLAGQTIVESVPVTLPEIRGPTFFRIEVSTQDRLVARIPILACPRDMLRRLAELSGDPPLGIYDREGKLKTSLTQLGIPFTDLELADGPAGFLGRVAILGPFTSEGGASPDWKELSGKLASRGVAVVVLLPQPRTLPFAEVLHKGPVVIARGVRVDDLAESAARQMALLRVVELALTPVSKPSP
jgi:hypothetical protein